MSKLNIHRDQPQPSDEQLLKHKNFDDVLKNAGKGSIATNVSTSIWKNPMTWIGGAAIITGIVFFLNTSPITEPEQTTEQIVENSPQSNPDSKHIMTVKTKDQEPKTVDNKTQDSITKPITETAPSVNAEIATVDSITTGKEPTKPKPLELKEPDGEPLRLSEDFHLIANFREFDNYDQVQFQPLDEFKQSYRNVSWDSAALSKTDSGYELTLHKNGNPLVVRVKPTL